MVLPLILCKDVRKKIFFVETGGKRKTGDKQGRNVESEWQRQKRDEMCLVGVGKGNNVCLVSVCVCLFGCVVCCSMEWVGGKETNDHAEKGGNKKKKKRVGEERGTKRAETFFFCADREGGQKENSHHFFYVHQKVKEVT